MWQDVLIFSCLVSSEDKNLPPDFKLVPGSSPLSIRSGSARSIGKIDLSLSGK